MPHGEEDASPATRLIVTAMAKALKLPMPEVLAENFDLGFQQF